MKRRYFEKNIIKMDQEHYTPTQRKIFQFRAKDGFNNNEKINPQMKRRNFVKRT